MDIYTSTKIPDDFAGKNMLNILLDKVLPKHYLLFYSHDSVSLTLGCKLASFYHLCTI